MTQPSPNEPVNPYAAPAEVSEPPAIALAEVRKLPSEHWGIVIGLFMVAMLFTFLTYGLLLPVAISILIGGIRTSAVYRMCHRVGVQPPSYLATSFLSPIACGTLLIGCGTLFMGICSVGLTMNSGGEVPMLILAALISIVVYVLLIYASIRLNVATRQRWNSVK